MATIVRSWLDFALLQSASESYLNKASDLKNDVEIQRILKEGANNAALQRKSPEDPVLSGATRFTDVQAKWFTDNYEIVTHYPNDSSGFSATLVGRVQAACGGIRYRRHKRSEFTRQRRVN